MGGGEGVGICIGIYDEKRQFVFFLKKIKNNSQKELTK